MRRPPRGAKLERKRAPPVRVSRALTRRVPWYVLAGMIFGLFQFHRLQAQEAERKAAEDAAWARLRQEEKAAEEKAAQERERAADQPVAVAQGLIVASLVPQILYQTVFYGV